MLFIKNDTTDSRYLFLDLIKRKINGVTYMFLIPLTSKHTIRMIFFYHQCKSIINSGIQ